MRRFVPSLLPNLPDLPRLTVLLAPLVLAGCTGFGTFLDHSFGPPGRNPNRPAADSENMRRAYGRQNGVQPLKPEPGNVWPAPEGPDPTLTDIERQQNQGGGDQGQGQQGQGQQGQGQQDQGQRGRARGSSTPPAPVSPRLPGSPGVPALPPAPPGVAAPPAPGAFTPGGTVVTPNGNGSDAGGTNSYRQLTTPGGPGAIVVPNGNGTSTIISPNGGVQVIPTPR